MTTIHRSALVAQPPARLFELVNDVAAYPRRFDWCIGSQVLEKSKKSMLARLDVRVAGMPVSFTTRNTLTPVARIELELAEGPFRDFGGFWSFDALGDAGCRVGLQLHFELAGKLLGTALALGFAGFADRLVDDFCKVARAEAGSAA
ncbi:MAG: type II toxin-antitoxin system RatA family toxin [Proteobacteria bacterium]|nr:type II toxin-antitoxin system RatA family toxin [Pseudomonadota bacterium]